jgi:hypothetical protein
MVRAPIPARQAPRISANELALFMVSSDTARVSIVSRSKNPTAPLAVRYRDVRAPLCTYLADPNRRVNPLQTAETMFRQRAEDNTQSVLRQDDARQSIQVIQAIQRMANRLAPYDFTLAPARQPKLILSGVEVSVRADLLLRASVRGSDQVGAALFRLTQDDAGTDSAVAKRKDMGLYVATLARMHVGQNLAGNNTPANRLCMSIDVQHGEIFAAPDASTRRTNDLTNACRFIAALWDTV